MIFIEIHWEGRSYLVPTVDRQVTPGNPYTDFVSLLEALGVKGRSDLISVLAVNYGDEVKKVVNEVARKPMRI